MISELLFVPAAQRKLGGGDDFGMAFRSGNWVEVFKKQHSGNWGEVIRKAPKVSANFRLVVLSCMDSYDSKKRRILQRFSEVVQRHQLVVQRHELVVQRHAYSEEMLTLAVRGQEVVGAARSTLWKVRDLLLIIYV